MHRANIRLLLALAAELLCCAACATREPPPQQAAAREHILKPAPALERIAGAEGTMQRILYSAPVRGGRLEIRTFILPRGERLVVTADYEAAFELRSGAISSSVAGESAQRIPGDIWNARAGDKMVFRVTSDRAVVRAIVFVRRPY